MRHGCQYNILAGTEYYNVKVFANFESEKYFLWFYLIKSIYLGAFQ